MWKFVFLSVYLFYITCPVHAAVAILTPQEKPDKFACQEGCYVPDLDRVIPYNEKYSPQDGTKCEEYSCNENGNTQIFSCGALAVTGSCTRTPGNLSSAYPDCCDSASCPTDETATA